MLSIASSVTRRAFPLSQRSMLAIAFQDNSIKHFRYLSSKPDPTPPKQIEDVEANDEKEKLSTDKNEGIDSFTLAKMENRHAGIFMNPNGLSQHVLPGDQIVKTNQKTGNKRMVAIERSLGYFWYLKDLSQTESKPILANDSLIPVDEAKTFPILNGVNDGSLMSLNGNEEALPHFFTKDNRSNDPIAMITLVGVAFNDYGNKMLPSWMEPFENTFRNDKSRVKTCLLSINEGFALKLLKPFITSASKGKVPDEKKDNTLLYFGDCTDFKDVLRMHNNKTGYVFLLDGLGRVRWAASGNATDAELKSLLTLSKELAPGLNNSNGKGDRKKPSFRNSTFYKR